MKTELSIRNPFTDLGETTNPLRNLMTSIFGGDNGFARGTKNEIWIPAVDIEETDSSFLVTADLPDVKKKDIKVTIEDGLLVIKAERDKLEEIDKKNYHRIERFHGNYQRSFYLPENADAEKMKAKLSDGALEITLPKLKSEKKQSVKEVAID